MRFPAQQTSQSELDAQPTARDSPQPRERQSCQRQQARAQHPGPNRPNQFPTHATHPEPIHGAARGGAPRQRTARARGLTSKAPIPQLVAQNLAKSVQLAKVQRAKVEKEVPIRETSRVGVLKHLPNVQICSSLARTRLPGRPVKAPRHDLHDGAVGAPSHESPSDRSLRALRHHKASENAGNTSGATCIDQHFTFDVDWTDCYRLVKQAHATGWHPRNGAASQPQNGTTGWRWSGVTATEWGHGVEMERRHSHRMGPRDGDGAASQPQNGAMGWRWSGVTATEWGHGMEMERRHSHRMGPRDGDGTASQPQNGATGWRWSGVTATGWKWSRPAS
jgi:hypothetical protein